jgi:predicted dehydrogenase
VVAVCDRQPAALARALNRWPFLRAYRSVETMLDAVRPDVVSVCTWPQTHCDLVRLAAGSGVRGIMCEKPLALSADEMDRMRRVCLDSEVKLAGGHQYRFNPFFSHAAELIRTGQLGNIQNITGEIEGTLADNGPHLMDTFAFLFSDHSPVATRCDCRREKENCYQDIPAEDSASGWVELDGGIRMDFNAGERASDLFSISIRGSEGILKVGRDFLHFNGEPQEIPDADSDYHTERFRRFVL